jgi:hypothetical protein
MTVKNMTRKSRFRVKSKTKIGKSKYSVLVACHMSNAVNKASYLEIFCVTRCQPAQNFRSFSSEVHGEKISKIDSKLTELWRISHLPLKFLKCDVARNIDFRINADVNTVTQLSFGSKL